MFAVFIVLFKIVADYIDIGQVAEGFRQRLCIEIESPVPYGLFRNLLRGCVLRIRIEAGDATGMVSECGSTALAAFAGAGHRNAAKAVAAAAVTTPAAKVKKNVGADKSMRFKLILPVL